MVRETRHLWVGNLPENIREDRIREHFKRYGRVQSIKLLPRMSEEKASEVSMACKVAFMDIKSASKAYNAEIKIDDKTLSMEYCEPVAIPSTASPPQGTPPPPFSTSPGNNTRFPNGHGSSDEHGFLDTTTSNTTRFYDRLSSSSLSSGTPGVSRTPPPDSFSECSRRLGGGGSGSTPVSDQPGGPTGLCRSGGGNRNRDRFRGGGGGGGVGGGSSGCSNNNRTTGNWISNYDSSRYNNSNERNHQSTDTTGYNNSSTTPSELCEIKRNLVSVRHKKDKSKSSGSRSPSLNGSISSQSPSRSRSSSSSPSSSSASRDSSSASSSRRSTTRHLRAHHNSKPNQCNNLGDRRLAICVKNFPTRSSDSSLKDGLFHEYKKLGKVTWVKIVGQNADRHGIVCFKKPEDVEKALEDGYNKLFFGNIVQVSPHTVCDNDESELHLESEIDEYNPKATRTLFIGNLEKDVTAADIRKHFDQFGDIIEIEIKKQGAVSPYAFCQFADIVSVVKAIRKMDGEHLGNNRIKLGFGKSMIHNCVWIDGVNESVNEKYLRTQFEPFGVVVQCVIDHSKGQALIFYEHSSQAQLAVSKMRGFMLTKKKLQVDFANRDCQDSFFKNLEKQGIVVDKIPFEDRRDSSGRNYEAHLINRISRLEPTRSRTSSYSSKSSVAAAVSSPSTPGNVTPRGNRARLGHYYNYDGTEGRHASHRNYDEYSQGSTASQDEPYDPYEHCGYFHDSPSQLDQPEARVPPNLAEPPLPYPSHDIRNLQKERVHLLEQLEECPSSGDELVGPKKKMKIDSLDPPIASGGDVIIETNRDHNRKIVDARRSQETFRHYIRRPSIDNKYGNHALHNINCKRRRVAGCEGTNKTGAHCHYNENTEEADREYTPSSRPGTPLCDENPDFPQIDAPKRVTRERDGPLNLPLPKFAAQIRDNPEFQKGTISIAGTKGQKEHVNPLSSPPPVATSPRVLHHHTRPPSPTHSVVPPPASPPLRPPSLSSNSSDSDLPPPSPSLEERIKSLDEMCQKYEKMSGTRPLQNTGSDAPPALNLTNGKFKLGNKLLNIQNPQEIQPSDIVKSLMAKRSVFDEDLKRLEKVEEKYEPKEFDLISSRLVSTSSTNASPIISNLPPPDLKVLTNPPAHSKTSSTLSPKPTNSFVNMPPATRALQYPFPSHPPPATASTATTPHHSSSSSSSGLISSPLMAPQMMVISSASTAFTPSESTIRSNDFIRQCEIKPFVNTSSSCDNLRNSNIKSHHNVSSSSSSSNCNENSSFSETNNNAASKLLPTETKKNLSRRNSNSTSPRTEFKNARRNSDTFNNVKRTENQEKVHKSVEGLKSSEAVVVKEAHLEKKDKTSNDHDPIEKTKSENKLLDSQKSEKEKSKINRESIENCSSRSKSEKEHKIKPEKELVAAVTKNIDTERRERNEHHKDITEIQRKEKSLSQEELGELHHKIEKEIRKESKEHTTAVNPVVPKDEIDVRVAKDRRKSKELDNHDRTNNKHREHHSSAKYKENSSSQHTDKHHSLPKEAKDDKESTKGNCSNAEHPEQQQRDCERRRQSIKENKDNNLHEKQKNHTIENKDTVVSAAKDRLTTVESRHLSIDLDKAPVFDCNKRKDRNNSLPAAIVGLKRRISSHESLELNDECSSTKRAKLEPKKISSDRRDSKDSSKNDEKSKKSKHKNNRHNSCDVAETNADSKHKQKIKERDEKYKKYKLTKLKPKNKSKEKHFKDLLSGNSSTSSSNDFLVKSIQADSSSRDKDVKIKRTVEDKDKSKKERINDSKESLKSNPDDSKSSKLAISDSRKGQQEKHSIFEIDKEDPPYISMYDKVKARSCKNMQKQEEEKRQEKIKAKFSQLKLSRAKREEKKRSTSWDEDSDSDKDVEKKPRRPKKVLSDSSEDESLGRRGSGRHRARRANSDSESSIQTSVTKIEDPDSSDNEIKCKTKHVPIKMSKSRIASDTSDDEDYDKNNHHHHHHHRPIVKQSSKKESMIHSELETEQDDSRDVKTSEKITSVKCEIEKLVKKERRNSKLQEFQSGEFQTLDSLHSEPAEVKIEKPNVVTAYDMEVDNEDDDIIKKEKFERREKKHRKKLKKQKHSISIENSFKTDPEIVKTDTPERKHFDKKRSHSKKDKRRDKTKERKDKYKKSKKNKFESKSMSKREGKMENIFGSLSEDSECESRDNVCLSDKYAPLEEPATIMYNNSGGGSDDGLEPSISLGGFSVKDNEHKRKKEKKHREKKKRFQEALVLEQSTVEESPQVSNENSMDFIDMGKQLEANIKDDISEMEYKIEESEEISYDTSVPYNFTDNEVKKEKDDFREGKEKKKKRKKSRDEKKHHIHHNERTKRKDSDAKSEKSTTDISDKFVVNIEAKTDQSSADSSSSNNQCITFHNKQSHSLPNLLEQPAASISAAPSHFPIPTSTATTTVTTVTTSNNDTPEIVSITKPKKDKLIPGFGLNIDETIHENAVKSICTELETDLSKTDDTKGEPLKIDNSSDSIEDKSRVIISQEETEDAVAALLEASFGTSQFKESYSDDIASEVISSEELTEPNNVQDDEEMRQAVQSLEANEVVLNKPDTPQSEHELQIDTDTEEQEENTTTATAIENPLKISLEDQTFSKNKIEVTESPLRINEERLLPKSTLPPSSCMAEVKVSNSSVRKRQISDDAVQTDNLETLEADTSAITTTTTTITTTTTLTPSLTEVKETWAAQPQHTNSSNQSKPTIPVVLPTPLVVNTFSTSLPLKISEVNYGKLTKPAESKTSPIIESKVPSTSVIQLHNLPALPPNQLCHKPPIAVSDNSSGGGVSSASVLSKAPPLTPSSLHLQRYSMRSVMVCKPLQSAAVYLPKPHQVHFSVPVSSVAPSTFHHHHSPDRSFILPPYQPLYSSKTTEIKLTPSPQSHTHHHSYESHMYNKEKKEQNIQSVDSVITPNVPSSSLNMSKTQPFIPTNPCPLPANVKTISTSTCVPTPYKFEKSSCSTSSPLLVRPGSNAQLKLMIPPPMFPPIFKPPSVIASTTLHSMENVELSKSAPEDLTKSDMVRIHVENKAFAERTCLPSSIENIRRSSGSSPLIPLNPVHREMNLTETVSDPSKLELVQKNVSVQSGVSSDKPSQYLETNLDPKPVVSSDDCKKVEETTATSKGENINQETQPELISRNETQSDKNTTSKVETDQEPSEENKKDGGDFWSAKDYVINSVIKTLNSADELSDNDNKTAEPQQQTTAPATTAESTLTDNSEPKLEDVELERKLLTSNDTSYEIIEESKVMPNLTPPRKGRGGRPKGSKTRANLNRGGVQTRRGKLKETLTPQHHPVNITKRGRKSKARKIEEAGKVNGENDTTTSTTNVAVTNDVYAFTEELDDATAAPSTTTSSATPSSMIITPTTSKEQYNNATSRFVLTVRKSTLDKSNSQATATVKEISKDGTIEILNDTRETPLSHQYKSNVEEQKPQLTTNTTRKSKRLAEKDTSKNAIDTTIDDVVKNMPITRGGTASAAATAANQRRSNRQIKKPQPLHAEQDMPKKQKNSKAKKAQRKMFDTVPTNEDGFAKEVQPYESVAANILEKAAAVTAVVAATANAKPSIEPVAAKSSNKIEQPQIECVRKTTDNCPPKTAMLKRYNASQPVETLPQSTTAATTTTTKLVASSSSEETSRPAAYPVTPTIDKPPETPLAHEPAEFHVEKTHLEPKATDQSRNQASVVIQRPAVPPLPLAQPTSVPQMPPQQQQPQQQQMPNMQQYPMPLNNPVVSVKNMNVNEHPIKPQGAVVSSHIYQTPINQMPPSVHKVLVSNANTPLLPMTPRSRPPLLRSNPNIQGVGPASPLAAISIATASKCGSIQIPTSSPHQQHTPPINSEEKYLLQTVYEQKRNQQVHLSQLKHGQDQLVSIGTKSAIATPVLTRDIPVSSPTGGKGYGVIQNAVMAGAAHQQHSNMAAAINMKNAMESASNMDLSKVVMRSANLRTSAQQSAMLSKSTFDMGEDSIYTERKKSPPPAHQNSPHGAQSDQITRLQSAGMSLSNLNPNHYMMPPQKLMSYHLMENRYTRPTGMETFGAEGEEAPIILSGRMAAVPHHSPHDRSTESPMTGQIYNSVQPTRHSNFHPNFFNQYTDNSQPSPPPSHRHVSNMPSDRANLPPPPPPHDSSERLLTPYTSNSYVHLMPMDTMPLRPPDAHTGHLGGVGQGMPSSAHSQYPTRVSYREPNDTYMPHVAVETPASQREIQVATPPVASQVPRQAENALSTEVEVRDFAELKNDLASNGLFLWQQYKLIWQGQLALKVELAAVQMYFISGNTGMVECLPTHKDGTTPLIRISQRMRLEPPQIEGVVKKMLVETEYCMLLALPCGTTHIDVVSQSANLLSGFIKYLVDKQAAGIINIPASGTSEPPAYVIHVFPKCDFIQETLNRFAPNLFQRLNGISYLIVIITTV